MRIAGKGLQAAPRYEAVSLIAHGGMARVDLVVRREGQFHRLFAVKRLHPHMRNDMEFRSMFLDEARIAGLIRHPNVVSVNDVGEDGEGPYLVMDYVEGMPLQHIIMQAAKQGHELPLSLCLRIAQQAAEGLHAAHELRGIDGEPLKLVHRDVSPHNILVGFDGIARVTDFGIAKALGRMTRTLTGVMKGKVGYMSPEQLQMGAADRRSDLFSLGVVLFESLALQRLYDPSSPNAKAQLHDDYLPDLGDYRADAPPSLVHLLFKMLARDPAHRPESAADVARQIDGILDEVDPDARSIDLGAYLRAHFKEVMDEQQAEISAALRTARRRNAKRRRRPVVAVALAAAMVGAVGIGYSLTSPSATDVTSAQNRAVEPPYKAATADPTRDKQPNEQLKTTEQTPLVTTVAPPANPTSIKPKRDKQHANTRKKPKNSGSKVPWWDW